MTDRFVAVDWGTTNRRVYLIEEGEVTRSKRDDLGILSVPAGGFPALIEDLRTTMGDLPIILAGMVGSNRGWVDAGYVDCPARIEDIATSLVDPDKGVAIVPGVRRLGAGRADVMRGEEVQLLGAVDAGLAPSEGLLCQPGTHCKWATMADGAIGDFTTAMTGEMFALLKRHALIGSEMTGEVAEDAAFIAGVEASAAQDLLATLFEVRAAALLGTRASTDAASYVSGLLIGSDCRSRVVPGDTVHVLADPVLSGLYARAIACLGGRAVLVDSHAAFVSGIVRLRELVR